jgi:biopolymer transport protein ExbB
VAPGIAEALLATAMGLLAAIPAVVMYNAFARAITGYRAQLGDAAAEVLRHLSRDLDRDAAPGQKEEAPIVPIRRPAE